MSARKNGCQDLVDHRRLSDNDFAEFILHESAMLPKFLQNIAEVSRFLVLWRSAQIGFKGKVSPENRLPCSLYFTVSPLLRQVWLRNGGSLGSLDSLLTQQALFATPTHGFLVQFSHFGFA